MKIIEPSVEYVNGNVGLFDRPKHVELCGRVCYKSEDKITDGSAEKFIAGIIKRGHEAVLEHARITLDLTDHPLTWSRIRLIRTAMNSAHGVFDYLISTQDKDTQIVSGNIRAWRNLSFFALHNDFALPTVVRRMWLENAVFFPEIVHEDDEYISDTLTDINPDRCVPTFADVKRRTVHSWHTLRFICDRGVSHEIVRHRPVAYCQESTRYCNYSKEGFGGEITVIKPSFFAVGSEQYHAWRDACSNAEVDYFHLLNLGCSPQEARDVLPTSLKTELVMTATAAEWKHFLKLRTAEAAHPQMREVATRAKGILIEKDPEVFGVD